MNKFDNVFKKISEALPTTPTQPQPAAGQAQQPKPVTGAQTQQQVDPKIVQELIAAKNEQQVKLALQKLQAVQSATQQKPATGTTQQQPAV